MRNTLETRLGMFFALALVAAFLVMELIGSFDFFTSGTRVRARFENIQELKAGDPVKMAGVEIGRVEKVDLAEGKVEVTLKIDKPDHVKTDSIATISFAGLMGQNYVSITFGSAAAPLATDLLQTQEQADFGMLMAKLESVATGVENFTKTLSGDSIQNVLGPLTSFMEENNPRMSAIFANLQVLSAQIASGEGTMGKLITDDELYTSALSAVTNMSGMTAGFEATIGSAQTLLADLSEGKGTLGKLTKDEALYRETTTAMTTLREILQKINSGQGSVGKLVTDDSFYKNAQLSLQKIDKAAEGLEDQGPLSVLGVAVGSLF